jgi:hypothetical protein
MYSLKKSSGLMIFLLIVFSACCWAEALFSEDFNQEVRLIGRSSQVQCYLPLKYAEGLAGWNKKDDGMPAHYVEQYPGNWAFMLVANSPGQNIFTQDQGFEANDKGHVYTVSFDSGAGVYSGLSQATADGDQFAVALLRRDGTADQSEK